MRELLIGQRIKKFRKKKDLTQEEMAGHLNISFQTISNGKGVKVIPILPCFLHWQIILRSR